MSGVASGAPTAYNRDMQTETHTRTASPPLAEAQRSASHLTPLDLLFLGSVALNMVSCVVAARLAYGWITAALLDGFLGAYLLALVAHPRWRSLVLRLLLLGLVAGVCELATDAAGERFAHSLIYPAGAPFLWASPIY